MCLGGAFEVSSNSSDRRIGGGIFPFRHADLDLERKLTRSNRTIAPHPSLCPKKTRSSAPTRFPCTDDDSSQSPFPEISILNIFLSLHWRTFDFSVQISLY